MKTGKATHGQLRQKNRQLLLRTVYLGLANSRADLAHETGLAKPTVSDLTEELINDGYLVETGLGQSTDGGGKRPRLLQFTPGARQVIGLSLNTDRVVGVLANLDGQVLVEHYKNLAGATGDAIIDSLNAVINGLLAQLDAPLLCIGIGVPGLVDSGAGVVRYAPLLGWQGLPLAQIIEEKYHVPVYAANETELAAMAQFAFGQTGETDSLATILVDEGVGVGLVLDGALHHSGGEIGPLRIADPGAGMGSLESFLGWQSVRNRAQALYQNAEGRAAGPTYLHIRQAAADGDPIALGLQDELAGYLAQVFAWVIALLRPAHISLAGTIADLGQPLLNCILRKTEQMILPELLNLTTFSLDNSANLVAIGAVAHTLQLELGLI